MREIKFRVRRKMLDLWDKYIETKWVYFGLDEGIMDKPNCLMETLGQFTGLRDKNGKEIYEGDIVIQREEVKNPRTRESYKSPRFVERQGTIVFQNGCFDFKSERYCGQIRCYMGYGTGNIQLEIIGNVHENPELLGEKK